MTRTVEFSLIGFEDVSLKLKAVSYDAKYRGGRFALRKSAEELARIVRSNSQKVDNPLTDRSIPANVAVRWNRRLFDSTGNLGFRVGIIGGAGGNLPASQFESNPGGDTRYWRHLEFGTSRTRAQPFMRRSMTDNINKLTDIFAKEFGAAMTRALRRAGKQT
jgi:HK97 gp10 family phage protein